jgi:hypothetical protein
MLKKLSLILFIFVLLVSSANGEIRLILKSKATANGTNLYLSDIASLEGNNSEIEQIRNLFIMPEIYSDGYIDKKEIFILLKNHTSANCIIYGNAVRVVSVESQDKIVSVQSDFLLKKGDRIEVTINNKGISLILKGIAVNEGKFNNEIIVKIDNKSAFSKLIKGKITGKDTVEVNI